MNTPTKNAARIGRARTVLDGYMGMLGISECPLESIVDLLTDLRHLCSDDGNSFDSLNDLAAMHYAAEIEGPNPVTNRNFTTCHYCEEQGRGEVEVELFAEDGVWKGVCGCGEAFKFVTPPDEEEAPLPTITSARIHEIASAILPC